MANQIIEDHEDGTRTIPQLKQYILLMLSTLKSESQIIPGHTDPQSYNECWTFTTEEISDTLDALNELVK
jgi:hypothetical protein